MKPFAFARSVHLALALFVPLLAIPTRAAAQVPAKDLLPTFEVISTKNVSRVEGVNGSTIVWKDATVGRGVILLVKATLPADTVLWNTDFSLAYERGDVMHDRARARGITTAAGTPDADGAWLIGDMVRMSAEAGTRYFRVLFDLESEVTEVALQFARPVTRGVPVSTR